MIEIIDCEQNSPEWFAARMGIPTASMFSTVKAKGKEGGRSLTRDKYLRQLAGEIITGEPMGEGYVSADMQRGRDMEGEARDYYSLVKSAEPQRVGFIRNGSKGASPDSLIGETGGLEIKSAATHVQIERLQAGKVPAEYVDQIQGNLWVTEREFWDFVSYCPKMPPLILRVERDEARIAEIAKAVTAFNEELEAMVAWLKGLQ